MPCFHLQSQGFLQGVNQERKEAKRSKNQLEDSFGSFSLLLCFSGTRSAHFLLHIAVSVHKSTLYHQQELPAVPQSLKQPHSLGLHSQDCLTTLCHSHLTPLFQLFLLAISLVVLLTTFFERRRTSSNIPHEFNLDFGQIGYALFLLGTVLFFGSLLFYQDCSWESTPVCISNFRIVITLLAVQQIE